MLIDELLYGMQYIRDPHDLKTGLSLALRFQVDNVAKYAYETMIDIEKEEFYHLEDRIPNIAPLAPTMWFEFGGAAKGLGKPATNRYGCLITVTYDRNHKEYQPNDEAVQWYESNLPDKTRWVLVVLCFGKMLNELKNMNWIHYIAVAEDGRFINVIARQPFNPYREPEPEKRIAEFYNEGLVALLAICFAHCKGTEIKEHQPSRQVRRAAERAGKPVFTFHTIDIEPSRQVLRTEGHISENGLTRALHICRGHFAHYTTEKPLFGKYAGTFYRPMHIRGTAEAGISVKDYRVHPQEEESTPGRHNP